MKIGFFDSGVGGLTVLKETLKEINCEYIYLGDNLHSPYGTKTKEEVINYTEECVKILINKGCKVIVIACNTATSIAIKKLRSKYSNIVFIGTEPAIKVASDEEHKKILICATSLTIKGEKLNSLIDILKIKDKVDLMSADRLVLFAENGNICKEEIENYLRKLLKDKDITKYSHVVLGCTHFPLFKENFKNIFGMNTKIIDGSVGITNNLLKQLQLIGFDIRKEERKIKLIITKNDNNFVNNTKRILGINEIEVEVLKS